MVGGGDSALEEALFLTRFGSSVTVLHRRDQFRASKIMVERVLNNPKITVKMNTVATAIRGQKNAAGTQTGADAVTAAAPAAQNTGNLLSLKTTPMLNVSGSALNAPSSTGISLSAKAETADDSAGFVDIRDTVTGETGTLPAEGIFVAIGHEPATRFAKGSVDMDDDGYILVSGAGTHTSMPGVFAAGDCVDRVYRQAISAAGMGCRAALDAQSYLASLH